jgi:GAF domain-containing protein
VDSSDPLDLTLLLAAILHRAEKWVGTEDGYLCLLNPALDKLEIVYGTGIASPYNDGLIERGEGLAGKVWDSGEVLLISDYAQWSGRVSDERTYNRPTAVAAIGLPIRLGDAVVGVIGLFYTEKERSFTSDDIEFLLRMGASAGMILNNAALGRGEPIHTHIEAFHQAVPVAEET